MKFLALSVATIALSAIGVIAAPAADNAQYFTLTTETDYGCVYYASGTNTETATAPGVTSTIHDDSTKTVDVTTYVYPPQQTRRAEKPQREETTIGVTVVCATTQTVDPVVTTTDTNVVTTTTAYASTTTEIVETYTLCIEGHYCS
ncbi:uncharacterized protein SCHCODRAFT_01163577 [Schizophyllum commune H4-8]|uniref:uncharacterized protein n=1 Tax=Schizophyllum commune (strain H4-8 / FGSC 9210) TaxID=578458 RepID=UPI00215DE6DB|nr:uncharacterized protein SCHCODRAFT_01163577 [Schizophyllum commune H4-8]KAI5886293.1 hypothetical protein SCHCODRAFT_01163577 [Schizophyllum commune H4-8]